MAKAIIKTERTVTLELSEKEADWLREYLRNSHSETELPSDYEPRERISLR